MKYSQSLSVLLTCIVQSLVTYYSEENGTLAESVVIHKTSLELKKGYEPLKTLPAKGIEPGKRLGRGTSDDTYPDDKEVMKDYNLNFTTVDNSELLLSLSSAEAVDLCFLVDITGSMGPYIEGVRQSIRKVVDQLTNTNGRDNPLVDNLRLSFVGYRDFSDENQFEVFSFTPKVSKFLHFLNGVQALGGGDSPEDVFGGLERVAELEWSEKAVRVIFHMADAPCHHFRCVPYTGEDRLNRTAEELFKPFREQKIIYNFGEIRTRTRPMIKWFQEAYGEEISVFDLGFDRNNGGYAYGAYGGGGRRRFGGVGGERIPKEVVIGNAYLGAVLKSISKTVSD